MTIEEAREYWSKRLERAAEYSDEHWDAEERHAHKDYIDAMLHAAAALAICREREESAKKPKTNADRIRQMTDEELAKIMRSCKFCAYLVTGCQHNCTQGLLEWLKQEVSEDAGSKTD